MSEQSEVIPRRAEDIGVDINYLSPTVRNLTTILAAIERLVSDMEPYADISDVQEGLFMARAYASRLTLRDPFEMAREHAHDWAASKH